MTQQISDLAAIEAIKILKARYFRLVDLQRWQEFAELFTEDVSLLYPEARSEPFGFEDGMQMIRNDLQHAVSVHHGHMPEIHVTGADRAEGIWAMEDWVWYFADERRDQCLRHFHGFGHYYETYQQIGQTWRIKSLRLERVRKVTESGSVRYGC